VNKEPHAIVLGEEFHTMSQGDLSVDAFAQQMKQTADALREVGHTIPPAQLVLNLLRGINPRFATTADIIANTIPLPDFKSATNMLRVKELRLGTEHKEASASALATSTTSSCTSSSCRSTPSTSTRGGGGKGKGAKSRGGCGATALAAALVVGATSSDQHHQELSAGARVLSRLVLGFAITPGPPRGPISNSRGRRRRSSRGRRRRLLRRRTLPSRCPSSPLRLPPRRTGLEVAGIKPT
jgi:hypothetical protein